TARGERLFHVPLGGFLAAHGQIVDENVSVGLLQDAHNIVRGAFGFGDRLGKVLPEAVVGHATMHLDAKGGDIAEPVGIVGGGIDGVGQVLADLVLVNIE